MSWPTFYIPAAASFTPSGPTVGYAAERCGSSITFDLDVDFPGISVDDYVLYFVRIDDGAHGALLANPTSATPNRFIDQDSAVKPIWWETGDQDFKVDSNSSNRQGCLWACVYGGFVTATTQDVTFTRSAATYDLCGFAVAYRGISKRQPVDYMSGCNSEGNISAIPYTVSYAHRGHLLPALKTHNTTDALVFWALAENDTSFHGAPMDFYGNRSVLEDFTYFAQSRWDNTVNNEIHWHAWTEQIPVTTGAPVNMLDWDDIAAGGGGGGFVSAAWNLVNCTTGTSTISNGEFQTLIGSSGTSTTHYAYQDVTLEAGETYFLSMGAWDDTSSTGSPGLSIVDPDGVETGMVYKTSGAPNTFIVDQIGNEPAVMFDPTMEISGIPAECPMFFGFAYTPTQTGTYRVKVHVYRTTGGTTVQASYTGAASILIYPRMVSLTKGRLGVGADIDAGAGYRNYVTTGVYNQPSYGSQSWGWGCSLTEDDAVLNEVELVPHTWPAAPGHSGGPAWADDTRLVINEDKWQGSREFEAFVLTADRWVFPTYRLTENGSDTTGKYYFEATWTTASTGSWGIGVQWQSGRIYIGEQSDNDIAPYRWRSSSSYTLPTGSTRTGTPTSPASGNVLGVAIDYENQVVIFYKNGVEDWRATFPSAWNDAGGIPLRAFFNGVSGTTGNFPALTVNFKGPFSYKPSGFVAYDWANEA